MIFEVEIAIKIIAPTTILKAYGVTPIKLSPFWVTAIIKTPKKQPRTEPRPPPNLAPPKTTNPHDYSRTPGGSSSGSAAVIASHMAPLSIGSQTGGSVIRPASYCGVVGYKPSYGLISRNGVLRTSYNLDHIGVFGRTVEDVALLAKVLIKKELLSLKILK